ncbi:hypothetical protein PVAG01_11144 [Phlyctema vagabunda]|uniref:Uncharacterized protein n=1 Tax=Phlyctema vagabunda TaxID=108571 RepID=A0ABR4P1G1_9HELO
MHLLSIYAAATAFATSYGTVYDLYRNGSSPQQLASAVASYTRVSSFTAFFLGNAASNQTVASITDATLKAFYFLEDAGIGNNVTLEALRVEPLSDATSLCWLTWRIHPRTGSGFESFSWTTLYGYRSELDVLAGIEVPGGNGSETEDMRREEEEGASTEKHCGSEGARPSGGWEFGVNDDEIVKFSSRIPNYIDSYVFPTRT